MAWEDTARENLLRLSRSQHFPTAMREWFMTGGYQDLHACMGDCELCEQTELRYYFEIKNRITGHVLWVGSTCITYFVPIFEGDAEVVGERDKAAYLNRWIAEAKRDERQKRAFALIDRLAEVDAKFRPVRDPEGQWVTSWKSTWERGYSARQLTMIAAICAQHRFRFNAGDFRINTRREGVREQVLNLQTWQYRQLRPAIPKSRWSEFDEAHGLT